MGKKDYWRQILWSDETKINVFGSDGRIYVRRERGNRYLKKYLTPTVKHDKVNIKLWGCFSYNGVGRLEIIKGNMDVIMYTKILKKNLKKSAKDLGLDENFVFHQDNDPKHTAKITDDWFEKNDINVLDWPSQSPDLNLIKNHWQYLKLRVHERLAKSVKDLEEKVIEEWYKIPVQVCQIYIESMERRIEAVFRSKGGN
ncbi:TCB1 [Hepatospora eriocheir]|uniref:TCB1 n=1 Tax=Hepatospora eriocheir TaxID=1081669 RepID=A0A1X0QIC2_9MICR|nr:TCB1 [Hepatospora eriocheir]